jgi:hypothetical protein
MRTFGLSTLSVLWVSGCLADPPTYEAPARIPPVVTTSQVDPPPAVVFELPPGVDAMEVTVPFRSEDLGTPVVAKFLIDAAPGRESRSTRGPFQYDPSTFDDESRQIRETVTGLSGTPGCHTVTLLLSNSINFGEELNDESLATRVMWFVAVPGADTDDILLSDCPTLGQEVGAVGQ